MANAVRMSIIRELGLDYVPAEHPRTKARLAGWNHAFLMHGIFEKKLCTMNFPLFSELYMFHLGGGIVDQHVPGRSMRKFAYCEDFVGRYGGKGGNINNDWYSGRLVVNMTHDNYVNYLRKQYNRPFDDVQQLDESIFKVID
jgi:hypothetical protein